MFAGVGVIQVGVCGLVVAYNILGAFVFRAVEGKFGDPSPEEAASHLRDEMVGRLWNVTVKLNVLEEGQWRQEVVGALEDFQKSVVPLVKTRGYRGVVPLEAWSFSAALMYSLSVYTTIGQSSYLLHTSEFWSIPLVSLIIVLIFLLDKR